MSSQLDRHGLTFETCLGFQTSHLRMWQARLKPEVFEPMAAFVIQQNAPAQTPEQHHHVWRGQDLVQIVMDWPDVKPHYRPLAVEVVTQTPVEAKAIEECV